MPIEIHTNAYSDDDEMKRVYPPDPDELVRWAEMYGHPEEWAKKAQAAHARAERLSELLLTFADKATAEERARYGFALKSEVDELRAIIARAARLCEGRDTAMVLQVLREAESVGPR